MSLGVIALRVVIRISVNMVYSLGLGLAYFRDLCDYDEHQN